MIFKSRKSLLFILVVYAVLVSILWLIPTFYIKEGIKTNNIFLYIVLFGTSGLLFWIFYGTQYVLTATILQYKSGPIKGKIPINTIHEIIVGKSLWVGIKPATATKGLIIKYGKFDEIYISPITNKSFVAAITKLNPNIKITYHNEK